MVGGPVADLTVTPEEPPLAGLQKLNARMAEQIGGSAVHQSRAISAYGGEARPCFLVGKDRYGDYVAEQLAEEFPQALFERIYQHTRRSVILPRQPCYTLRQALTQQRHTADVAHCVADAAVTIVGPLMAADSKYASELLHGARRSVLQLSSDQLQQRSQARELMELATITVLNDAEAELLTGHRDPLDAIMACREHGSPGVAITRRDGVWAWLDGDWHFSPAVAQQHVVQTVGAGDIFTGVLALALARECAAADALADGQAAAGRHVAGLPPVGSLEALRSWAASQPKTRPDVPPDDSMFPGGRLAAAAVAVGVVIALLSVWSR